MLSSRFGTRYVGDMDRMFDTYSLLVDKVTEHVRATVPRSEGDSDFVYRQATRAKALDAVRGVLRRIAVQRGIYGTGQAFEALLLRMRSQPAARGAVVRRPDARGTPQGHPQLPAPSRPGRPGWSLERVLASTRDATADIVGQLFAETPIDPSPPWC